MKNGPEDVIYMYLNSLDGYMFASKGFSKLFNHSITVPPCGLMLALKAILPEPTLR